jgi:hypothetical protein
MIPVEPARYLPGNPEHAPALRSHGSLLRAGAPRRPWPSTHEQVVCFDDRLAAIAAGSNVPCAIPFKGAESADDV